MPWSQGTGSGNLIWSKKSAKTSGMPRSKSSRFLNSTCLQRIFCVKYRWHGRVMWFWSGIFIENSIFLHVTWPNHQIHSSSIHRHPEPGTYPNIWPNACQFASCSWAKASSCDETMCRGRLVIKSKRYRLVTQSSLHVSKNDSCKMTTGTSIKMDTLGNW